MPSHSRCSKTLAPLLAAGGSGAKALLTCCCLAQVFCSIDLPAQVLHPSSFILRILHPSSPVFFHSSVRLILHTPYVQDHQQKWSSSISAHTLADQGVLYHRSPVGKYSLVVLLVSKIGVDLALLPRASFDDWGLPMAA